MLPPSLQKNIRELDRQISLLETECQNMESENKLTGGSSKITSEIFTRENSNKSSIGVPVGSTSLHSSRKTNTVPVVSKMLSASCIRRKASNELKKPGVTNSEPVEKNLGKSNHDSKHTDRKTSKHSDESDEKAGKVTKTDNESCIHNNGTDKCRVESEESARTCKDDKNKVLLSKRSITSIKEVTESSDENEPAIRYQSKQKKPNSAMKSHPKGATWSDLFCQQGVVQENRGKRFCKKSKDVHYNSTFRSGETWSSDGTKDTSYNETEDKTPSDKDNKFNRSAQDKVFKKRRTRSVRTRKHYEDENSDDGQGSKALQDKHIHQNRIRNQERENNNFWCNLNSCIKTLHFLTGDLKTKNSRNRRHEILNEMQNTILRISDLKTSLPPGTVKKSLDKGKILEGEETNIVELKKALIGVKQFCEEMAHEKSVLSEEIASKNRLIFSMKDQEKEYLSLISNLKFNLEKLKEESVEESRLKKDLALTKNKLLEEGKVIEALKKSHEKMQVLIENYVMENDRLRTQIKLSKLESHKYHVLLAGKEIEIKKYKEDIEQFQKQITEQLNILKSKAKENRLEDTINIISNQANIFTPTEAGSTFSETTTEKHSYIDNVYTVSGNTSLNSTFTREGDKNKELTTKNVSENNTRGEEQQREGEVEQNIEKKPCDESGKTRDGGFTCKSDGSDAEGKNGAQDQLTYDVNMNGLLSNSKKLRSSIEELIQGVRRECLDKFWPSPQNSVDTSLCTLGSNSSEILSENNQQP